MDIRYLINNNSKENDYKKYNISQIDDAIREVRKNLTNDLLKPEFRNNNIHPMYGHCYVAAESLWHLTGRTLQIFRGRDDEGIVHWWLQDGMGHIYDPTYDQYTDRGKEPPYQVGRRSGFLTGNKPSKRTKELLSNLNTHR